MFHLPTNFLSNFIVKVIRGNVYLDTELKESAIEMFKNYGLSLNIEQINPNDPDYKLVEEARKNRTNRKKIYSLDDVMKEFNAN